LKENWLWKRLRTLRKTDCEEKKVHAYGSGLKASKPNRVHEDASTLYTQQIL
jgi:hypothetical protein